MSQNNQSIVNSQEFKDLRKENNLEVLNLEAICVMLYQIMQPRINRTVTINPQVLPISEINDFFNLQIK